MSEAAPSGFHQFEEAVEAAQANAPTAEDLNNTMANNLAIEARRNTAEVARLNDAAEIAIYGTRGQTAGYVDAAGKPLRAPIKGKIDLIKDSPRWGNSKAGRKNAQEAAQKYANSVDELLGEGFELCQAKLILDQRDLWNGANDQHTRLENKEKNIHAREVDRRIGVIAQQYEKNGDAPDVAQAKATQRVAGHKLEATKVEGKIDLESEESKLKNLIRTQGIFSRGELKTALASPKSPEDIKKAEEHEKTRNHLAIELHNARDRYARLSAGRGRRGLHIRKEFKESSVEAARSNYEAIRKKLVNSEIQVAYDAGVELADLDIVVEASAIEDAHRVATALHMHRLAATGKYDIKINRTTGQQELALAGQNTIIGKATGAFYDWWGKQEDAKFLSTATVKKALAMGTIGVVVGAPTALAGGIVLGPLVGGVAGAFAANKIAKSLMAAHIAKRSNSHKAGVLDYNLRTAIENGQAETITSEIDTQTGNQVKANRRRTALSIGTAALGGVGAEIGISHLINGGHSGGNQHPSLSRPNHPHDVTHHHGVSPQHSHARGVRHGNRHPVGHNAELSYSGDTISNEVADKLHLQGGTVLNRDVAATLHANGLTFEQARHLPVGFKFNIPPAEVMEQLAKKK